MNKIENTEVVRRRIHYSPEVRAKFIQVKRSSGYEAPEALPQFDEAALRRAFLYLSNRMGLVGSRSGNIETPPKPRSDITPIRPDINIE